MSEGRPDHRDGPGQRLPASCRQCKNDSARRRITTLCTTNPSVPARRLDAAFLHPSSETAEAASGFRLDMKRRSGPASTEDCKLKPVVGLQRLSRKDRRFPGRRQRPGALIEFREVSLEQALTQSAGTGTARLGEETGRLRPGRTPISWTTPRTMGMPPPSRFDKRRKP
jgi:hypothetical protein